MGVRRNFTSVLYAAKRRPLLIAFVLVTAVTYFIVFDPFKSTQTSLRLGARDTRPRTYAHTFNLGGRVFGNEKNFKDVSSSVTTSVVFEFGRESIRSKFDMQFVDDVYLMCPAITYKDDGNIQLIMRIWLLPKLIELRKLNSRLMKNYIMGQTLNSNYDPVTSPRILGIPIPMIGEVGGPNDPRVLHHKGVSYVLFNKYLPTNKTCEGKPTNVQIYLYNLETDESRLLTIEGDAQKCREKNWVSMIVDDKVYIVYSLDPTLILQCDLAKAHCKVENTGKSFREASDDVHSDKPLLRGSTPYVLYKWPYYITLVHTRWVSEYHYDKNFNYLIYAIHLLVFNAQTYQIAYVSQPIDMSPEFMNRHMPFFGHMPNSFIYPVSLILRDSDTLHTGLHLNDRDSVIAEIKGLDNIMKEVYAFVKNDDKPTPGFVSEYMASMDLWKNIKVPEEAKAPEVQQAIEIEMKALQAKLKAKGIE
ncbi:uncharacterized protein LOC106152295 [Lingula anatina]|uniref:Uncharacterized protein LOC106152295 n=1 Tax=Lingula anatina TaxID=7574 RepID=A0A1S3H5I6_LINAN|nr:uncharacterized protein LOC106152295 [Lingula anatina]|eukprot:XP_013381268.1 uncharacterized protein LOC106152295 [Lingula anatina]